MGTDRELSTNDIQTDVISSVIYAKICFIALTLGFIVDNYSNDTKRVWKKKTFLSTNLTLRGVWGVGYSGAKLDFFT